MKKSSKELQFKVTSKEHGVSKPLSSDSNTQQEVNHMNKPLKSFMEAKSSEMLDELLQEETTPEAEAAEPVVIGDQPQIDKTLNRLTEVRLDFVWMEEVHLRHKTISRFLEKVFDSDQFADTNEYRSAWRTCGKTKLIAGMLYYEGITYHGFKFTYAFDMEGGQVVMNFIPSEVIALGGTVPKEFLP